MKFHGQPSRHKFISLNNYCVYGGLYSTLNGEIQTVGLLPYYVLCTFVPNMFTAAVRMPLSSLSGTAEALL